MRFWGLGVSGFRVEGDVGLAGTCGSYGQLGSQAWTVRAEEGAATWGQGLRFGRLQSGVVCISVAGFPVSPSCWRRESKPMPRV